MLIKGFSSDWLEELKYKNDIFEVVSGYVSMERKGGRYWGRCPFHHEKTPSFTVSSERGFFHCFGCHESGDVITFISKIENVDFVDAVTHLAARAGMKVPELKDLGEKVKKEEKDKLYSLMREAAKFYHSALKSAPKVKEYLKSRNINEITITKFGIGYSPDYISLITALKEKGYSENEIKNSGVAFEKGSELLDALGKRVIIPIFDSFGKVIAFGGRAWEKTDYAKYKNTRETSIFTKNKVLFGLNFVNKLKRVEKIEDLIIVEGYMDTIALVQADVQNVVASMGTSLTEQQARILKNNVDEVYICFDGDASGQVSALRGMDILKSKGLKVKVISLPEGLDPDNVVSKYGKSGFLEYKNKALPLIDYKLSLAEKGLDMLSPNGRSAYAKRALSIVAELDSVEKAVYIEEISKKSGIEKKVLENLKNFGSEKKSTKSAEVNTVTSAYTEACRFVLLSRLTAKPYAKSSFSRDILNIDTHIKIYDYIKDCEENNTSAHPSMIYNLGADKEECAEILNCYPKIQKPEEKRYYEDCLLIMEKEYYESVIANLMEEYDLTKDSKKQSEILNKISEINYKIRR